MATTLIHRLTLNPMGKMFKCLHLRNYKDDYSQTVHECSLDGPLQTLRFLFRYKFKMAATAELSLTLDSGKNVSKRFFSETMWIIETKLSRNDHLKVLYKVSVFLCRSKIQNGHHRRT